MTRTISKHTSKLMEGKNQANIKLNNCEWHNWTKMHAVHLFSPRKRTELSVGKCMSDQHVHYAEKALNEALGLQYKLKGTIIHRH